MNGPRTAGRARLAAALLGAALLCAAPAAAEIRALVVGLNDYEVKERLQGAADDAADLAAVLRGRGVKDLTVIERAAPIAAFRQRWGELVQRAGPGDLLVFTFAGHGVSAPERRRGNAYEKGFLFTPFDETRRADEILRDEAIYDLFQAATAKGAKVLFVVDACHAGLGVRNVDLRASAAPLRFQRFKLVGQGTSPAAPVDPAGVKARPANPGVTILSAQDERLAVHEVEIDGRLRGALSYAVARGLEGAADADRNGVVTAGELVRYVSPVVRTRSNNRQIPQFAVPDEGLALIGVPSASVPDTLPDLAPLALASVGDAPLPALDGAAQAAERRAAALIWDPSRREVLNPSGDILAGGIGPDRLQGAVDARRVVAALARYTEAVRGAALPTRIMPAPSSPGRLVRGPGAPDRHYAKGEEARIEADPVPGHRFLTVLNLSASGIVQDLWPLAERQDPLEWRLPEKPFVDLPVSAPYGADNVIFLASRRPLTELHAALRGMRERPAPRELYDALRRAVAGREVQIGIQAAYTCERLKDDGTCSATLSAPSR